MYRFNERIQWYIQFIQFNMVSINTMFYVDFLSDGSALCPFKGLLLYLVNLI